MFDYLLPFIDETTTEKELLEIIKSQSFSEKFDNDIENVAESFKHGKFNNCSTQEDLELYFEKNIDNKAICELSLKKVIIELQPYFDVKLLKSLSKEKLKEYLDKAFDSVIIHSVTEDYIEKTFDKNYFIPVIRVINTANELIINKRFVKDLYFNYLSEICDFDDDILEYIWNLFDSKKNEAIISSILNMRNDVEEMKEKIAAIFDVFKKFSDDNN